MLQSAFNKAFEILVGAFSRYHDTPRSQANVPELGAARIGLDEARAEARRTREAYLESIRRPILHPKQTGVGDDDLARLRVLGTGYIQG